MLLASLYHLISRYLLRSLSSPELPVPVLLIQGWLFFALVLLFVMLLLRDVALIVLWLSRRAGLAARLPGSPLRQAGIMIGIALVLSAYGVWQGVRPPEARSVEITLPDLPAALDGFTLAHITDLHASSLLRGPRVRVIVDTVMTMQPDLIVLSGDLTDGTVEKRRQDVAPLADLAAPHGVFSCIGNHEYYSDYSDWMARFAELGFTMLQNSHALIEVTGAFLVIAGTTDQVAERFSLPGPDLDAALAGSPENATRILLEHHPGNAEENATKGIHLQLSGHTHGGHFPGFNRIVARFNNGFVSGVYQLGSMQLYVSHGAGLWSGFPVRLGVPSEVTRIVLRTGA
jgi:predicted MPP superfamily phosphohydrolase